jgi:RHS repeat-associated protein
VPYAVTHHDDAYRDPGDPIDTILFADGLGKVVQTKKDASIYTGPAETDLTANAMIVSGRVVYDHRGRAVAAYYPTTEPKAVGGNLAFIVAADTTSPTLTTYDVLDRVKATRLPDTTETRVDYGIEVFKGHKRRSTTTTDAKLNVGKSYRDVKDRVLAVQENDPSPIVTEYAYDPLDQLVAVRDADGNVTTVEYDLLGRRTAIDSPDAGRTQLKYDRASNLVQKRTATLLSQGGAITYGYDFNRLTAIHYPDHDENDVTYTYGAASLLGQPGNRVGRITQVTSEGADKARKYGKLGELIEETVTVHSDTQGNSPNSPEVYTTKYLYDTWGRLQQMTYPDGEVLTYQYDAGGNVRRADGAKLGQAYPYVMRLEYDRFEQRAFLRDGNGIDTQYTYDPADRRLSQLQSQGPLAGEFQNLRYGYDEVGNITDLVNDVPAAQPNELGGRVQQNFEYDSLYRLKHATGSLDYKPNKHDAYSLDLQYSRIHNITHKTQTHTITSNGNKGVPQKKTTYDWAYTYAGVKPHAASLIGEHGYTYDPSGNQVTDDDVTNGQIRILDWDEENRLQEISDNGHTTTFKYDDAGERVIKRGAHGETAYVNQFWTVRNRSVATKHVFVGSSRMASKLSPGEGTANADGDPFAQVVGKWYLHRSQQGWVNGKNTQHNPNNQLGTSLPNGLAEDQFIFFFHPDHLGSTSFVTDRDGELYEHVGYFPFGETWVEQASNTENIPYLFTGKELDQETGLYYFGARYYDPRTSVWQSADPALMVSPTSKILAAYSYSFQNPLRLKDPNGMWPDGHFTPSEKKDLQAAGEGVLKGGYNSIVRSAIAEARTVVGALTAGAGPLGAPARAAAIEKLDAVEGAATFEVSPMYEVIGGLYVAAAGELVGPALGQLAETGLGRVLRGVEAAEAAGPTIEVKPVNATDLNRPYLRKGTREAIEAAAPRDAQGRPIDPNTRTPIAGKPHIGHKPGHEFWREKAAAQAEGLTQAEFNDRMNDPGLYQLEDPKSNMSHKYEQP